MNHIFKRGVSRNKLKRTLRRAGAGNIKIQSVAGGLKASFTAPTYCKGNGFIVDKHNGKFYGFWARINKL